MSRPVRSVGPDAKLRDVAVILSTEHISGLPVVERGNVVGVVSESDIVRVEQGSSGKAEGVLGWLLNSSSTPDDRLEARTAGEAMSSPALTIAPGRSIAEAARLMTEKGVNRLPVIVRGELVGILTRGDLVRAYARSNEEIEREIYEDVLIHTLWVSPERIGVSVSDGVVKLAGEARTRTEAELMAAYVKRVPGVSVVESELTWEVDDLHNRTASAPET